MNQAIKIAWSKLKNIILQEHLDDPLKVESIEQAMITCVDKNPAIIKSLKAGIPTIHEPGLKELLDETKDKLSFSDTIPPLRGEGVVLIAVGTPTKDNGDADLRYVDAAAKEVAACIRADAKLVVVNKSTVPIRNIIRELLTESKFIKVFVKTLLEVCEERLPKDLCGKARSGEINNFMGIGTPYEQLCKPKAVLKTRETNIDKCFEQKCLKAVQHINL